MTVLMSYITTITEGTEAVGGALGFTSGDLAGGEESAPDPGESPLVVGEDPVEAVAVAVGVAVAVAVAGVEGDWILENAESSSPGLRANG